MQSRELTPDCVPLYSFVPGRDMRVNPSRSPSVAGWRVVRAEEAVCLERWDAETCLWPTSTARSASLASRGAELLGGARSGQAPLDETLLYRPSSLEDGLLWPSREQLTRGPGRSPWAVGPGDVIVSRFLPPRAAFVSPGAPRHALDANCIRITGLRPAEALWLVGLLAHPMFAAALAQRSAGRMLPRVGARDLEDLPIPAAPAELGAVAEAWTEASDERLAVQRELLGLRAEAQGIADETVLPLPDASRPAWVAPAEVADTWAPDQAACVRYQLALARAGWLTLEHFLLREPERLRVAIPPARVLNLGGATGDLGFREPQLAPVQSPLFRLYADPLRPQEVLLSTLGTAPKVVLNLPPSPSTVWLSDQWARLDGGATPGALALVLETAQVGVQLASGATGAVRQFIGREELSAVRVPPLASSVAASLHGRLVGVLERRQRADARLRTLRDTLHAHVDRVLRGSA